MPAIHGYPGRTFHILAISVCITLTVPALFGAGQAETNESSTTSTDSMPEGAHTDKQGVPEKGSSADDGAYPARVVSLAPAVTEMLYAVGAGDQVVGVTEYCNYPPEATAKAKIGGFSIKAISMEAIIVLEPDMVIGITSMHEGLEKPLKTAGLSVVLLKNDTFQEVFASIKKIGELTGHQDMAETLCSDLESRANAVTAAVAAIPEEDRKTVFWEIWDNPLMAAGPGSFIGQSLKMAGARNIFSDASGDWPQVSLEEVIQRNPDVVISSNSHGGQQGIGDIAERPGWDQLQAVKEGRLFLLPDDLLSRPGPRVVEGLELVARLVYPEIFGE